MRLAAGIVIMLLCTAWGFRSSITLRKRCSLLRELRLLLEHFSIGISCTAPTLEELSKSGQGEFARLLREGLSETPDIRAAWGRAVDRLSEQSCCGKEEAGLLAELGQSLGTCSAESQLSLLKLYSARLDRLLEQAEEAAEKKGRLYRSGGVLAGLGAAVMLL